MKANKIEDKLKQYIEEHNITIKELSDLISKNRNTVTSILRGESMIDVNSLQQICDKYKIPLSYFIVDEEKKELLANIEILKDHVNRLEFYLSSFVLQEIENLKQEKPQNVPESIYEYHKIVQLARQYDLFKAHTKLGISNSSSGTLGNKRNGRRPNLL